MANRATEVPKSGKLWLGVEIDGEQVWGGFSAGETEVKACLRRWATGPGSGS